MDDCGIVHVSSGFRPAVAEAPGKRPVQDRKLIESAPGLEVVPEFLYTWLGLSKIGAIVVPINASFKENEAQYILSHSEAVAVVAGSHLISIVEAVKRSTEVPPVAVPLPMLDPEPSVVPGVGAS